MEIYMFNAGRDYSLYYNAPAAIEAKVLDEKKQYADLGDRIGESLKEFGKNVKEGAKKFGSKMRTRTSSILQEGACAENVNLNYADTLEEYAARDNFNRIVKREKVKNSLILGAGVISLIASVATPLILVPASSMVPAVVVGYQLDLRKSLSKGLNNISFVPNHDVAALEQIIAGEKGLELTNPDLIEYASKGL